MLGKMLRKTWFWLLLLGALLGVAALGVTVTVLHKTSSTEFCVSCHSMQTPLAEYQGSVHFQNVKGIRAECADCHIPNEPASYLWTKIRAVKDIYHEAIGTLDTPEKYEAHKLRIDAAEALLRAYNEALDAVMEHMFTQMHLMFDVFGRNNNYLTALQRHEQAVSARMQVRTAELAEWNERIMTTDDSHAASIQRIKASVERGNTLAQMSAEANIKLLRRYSSRAAAALNSAGVSVSASSAENSIEATIDSENCR